MQPETRKEDQPAGPHKDVKERKRRFQIVKLEERIAPGGNGRHGFSRESCKRICGS
jgi:hypothetical protein